MQIDVARARILVLGMVVVVRTGIIARAVAQHLQAPIRRKPPSSQRFGKSAERGRSHHAREADAFGRLHAALAPALEIDRVRATGLGQQLAVVVPHVEDALGRNRPLHQLELVPERLLQRPPHALGLGAIQKILACQETHPRIGQRTAERMSPGKDAPPGRIQQILELGWNGV